MTSLELTILMPCLNEAETLAACIEKAQAFLRGSGVSGEVVVADNGSTDGSQALAERLGARVVQVAERGYGAALYAGTLAAAGRFVIMGDSDDSYDFEHLMPFVEKLRDGHDLVMGNRFRGGIRPGAMPWKNRFIGNPVLTGIGRLFFQSPIGDFHCGLRGFSVEAFHKMDLRTTGMEFASEMVIKATLLGMRTCEVPTTLSPDGRSRPPHLRPWRDGWRHLRFMLIYSPRWLFIYPGLVLVLMGAAIGGWLWGGARQFMGLALDIHTMSYAGLMVLIGFQSMAFGMLSKIFAIQSGLLPDEPWLGRLYKFLTLEVGLLAGLLLLAGGLVGSMAALSIWGRHGFGPLDPRLSMRLVLPSAVAIALGVQVVLNSFFLSVLGLRMRRGGPPR